MLLLFILLLLLLLTLLLLLLYTLQDKVTELSFQVEEQMAADDMTERNKILDRYQR